MKKLKLTLLYLFGFAFILLLITVVINLPAFDEELLPEVAAIKNIQAEPYSVNNAYPAILALNSASGPSLKQATKTIRDHLNQQISESGKDYLTQADYQNLVGNGHDNSWKNTYYQCKSRTEKNCMASLIEDVINNPVSDERLSAQLKRYGDLIELIDYQDATQIDINAPYVAYGSIQQIKRLFLANAYFNQSSDEYLNIWRKDMKFWRMVLTKSHLLLTRMVSIASLSNSVDSISTSIRQGDLNSQQLIQLQRQIKTLSSSELDMGTTFDYEFKYGMSMIDTMEKEEPIGVTSWINFFQPQATHNFSYMHIFKPLSKMSALSTNEFYDYQINGQKDKDFKLPVSLSPSMFYNPTGKMMMGYAIPAYTDYNARAHDLNGMFYLLKLQIEIALKPSKNVEQLITQSQNTNPYTLKPMAYNKENHSIYFECMDKTSVCELSL